MSNENEKVVEMNQEVTENIQEQENNTVEIREVKRGPVAWFNGLKPWQKVVLGGAVVGVTVYGGVKLYKGLAKNSKQVVETVAEVIPMDTVTDAADAAVQELAKAE